MTGVREGNEATVWRRRTHLEDFEVRAAQRPEDEGEHGDEVSRADVKLLPRPHEGGFQWVLLRRICAMMDAIFS
jgi:hypothetical protein